MFFYKNNFFTELLSNVKKNNILINKIIKNYRKHPNKKIIFDGKNSLTYSELINLAFTNSIEIKKNKSKFIPIIVDRNIQSVVAILSVIFSKKYFVLSQIIFQKKELIFFSELLKVIF